MNARYVDINGNQEQINQKPVRRVNDMIGKRKVSNHDPQNSTILRRRTDPHFNRRGMMILKTGRKCTWEEIEVGEVFAYESCWCIFYKINKNNAMLLAEDYTAIFSLKWSPNLFNAGSISGLSPKFGSKKYWGTCEDPLYKLPLSVQRLWRTDQ